MSNTGYEEDYEANWKDGWRHDFMTDRWVPVGRCDRMAHMEEINERERNRCLSKFEMIPGSKPPQVDYRKVIKEYKRTTERRDYTVSFYLRPWSVLKQTIDHLLLDICLRKDNWLDISDFVFDRFKAVRQDAIIQRLEGLRYIEILEGSIRFLVYSMYKLTCTMKDYTFNLDPSKVMIPTQGPVSGLDNYELNIIREMKLTMKCLRDCLNSVIVQYQDNCPDCETRPLFEAVNLIVNLPFLHGSVASCTEFQATQKLRNKSEMFKTIFRMSRDHRVGNHVTAIRRLTTLKDYPLLILAYAPAIAKLQVNLVPLLIRLYSATGANTSSLDHLASIICPQWLERDAQERRLFTQMMAIQFGIFDKNRGICDYKLPKTKPQTVNTPNEKLHRDEPHTENETRHYAMQMIAGREWSLFVDVLKECGGPRSVLATKPTENTEP